MITHGAESERIKINFDNIFSLQDENHNEYMDLLKVNIITRRFPLSLSHLHVSLLVRWAMPKTTEKFSAPFTYSNPLERDSIYVRPTFFVPGNCLIQCIYDSFRQGDIGCVQNAKLVGGGLDLNRVWRLQKQEYEDRYDHHYDSDVKKLDRGSFGNSTPER